MAKGWKILGDQGAGFDEILTPGAMDFVTDLQRKFGPQVAELLAAREARQWLLDKGENPDFLAETLSIRKAEWKVTNIPEDLQDRRVEITGPTDRKMIINALNSGAKVFMADCEDSLSQTWDNVVVGQINLRDAVRRKIDFSSPEGKQYQLKDKIATLVVRPRGWHLYEKHLTVDGEQIPGAFVDFGLYMYHNAKELLKRGTGPYFYLPKLEGHLEARLWADVLSYSEKTLELGSSVIKVTVLIETILAAFEMDEILYELRHYIVGLNCGRWDYIFSFIKRFRNRPDFVMPDRHEVGMTRHFLRSYSLLLIKTCHRRGAFAMGGMAAQIPIKNDPVANSEAIAKVVADKEREAGNGHDGTWVAHPGLVPVAMDVFDKHMPQPNQLDKLRLDVEITAADLLKVPSGKITETGLRNNISVGVQYLASWLGGNGCVPINNLMEDAATAEISRAQLWQWIKHPRGVLDDGRRVTVALFETLLTEELQAIRQEIGEAAYTAGNFDPAAEIFREITESREFVEFITLPAYARLA